MFDMTAPVTLPSADRLNTGGAYVVTVYLPGEAEQMSRADWGEVLKRLEPLDVWPPRFDYLGTPFVFGTVTPDGSLSVEPEPWAARHYRRAVMRGAGVYRWGLWAMLAPGRPAAEPDAQAGAALNGAAQLDAVILAARGRVRHSVRWKTPKTGRKVYKSWGLDLLDPCPFGSHPRTHRDRYKHHEHMRGHYRYLVAEMLGVSEGSEHDIREQATRAVQAYKHLGHFPEFGVGFSCNIGRAYIIEMDEAQWLTVLGLFPDLFSEYLQINAARRVTLAPLLARLIKRGDIYRAHLARIVKPRRAPRRAPRPLHAQPRPPAAPLAPPALA